MDRSFLDADIPTLVEKSLTIDERIALLGAPNWWNTTSIPRLNIPSIRMSDGPNGVRGSSQFISVPAQCFPCGTAMGATFDPELIHELGTFLGEETKAKSSVILLAPTCNIQRSPLGGRAFESFSEDPYLSGTMAASYVNGLQETAIKHFVANDQEHERNAADSVVSERALREIYLYPFMLAQKHAKPGAYMTSYGRLNGLHCSENADLQQKILRDEWDFRGLVWTSRCPAPPRFRASLLVNHMLTAQKLHLKTLNERVTNLLAFVQRQARRNPEVVYGDGVERTRDSPEMRAFARKLAGEAIVLLKNREGMLPLTKEKSVKSVAVIGSHAMRAIISGGGSAALKPSYAVTPYDGLVDGAPEGVELKYTVGCYSDKYLPTVENNLTTPSGEPGWLCTFYNHDENDKPLPEPLTSVVVNDARIKLTDFVPPGLAPKWSVKLTGKLTVKKTAPFELGLTVAGRAKLWVNGKMTIDNWDNQTPGDFFYGQGTIEEKAVVDLTADTPVDILVEFSNVMPARAGETAIATQPALMRGVRLGGAEKIDADEAIEQAVALAKECDAVVFVAGLTPEWESEGFDRPTLDLPLRQHEAIARVAAANPKTCVVIQAGSATSMPWIDQVGAIVQSWYLGNEVGNAIADVIWGHVNPSGRLPLTFPARIEDTPALGNMKSENGKIHYREDLFVGYKHYHARKMQPLFAFGFGLSYTTFSFKDLSVSEPKSTTNDVGVHITLTVKNDGSVAGSEVAQVYITYPEDAGLPLTPTYQLRGFAKAKNVASGSSKELSIALDRTAFAFWDINGRGFGAGAWKVVKGKYGVSVGASAEDIRLVGEVTVEEELTWVGL
ncbi:Beta-glucosidase [Mycena chlorophos]|uniref:beta-glucosidase n=1 Tax=Mycena chlorophos TaxID=658473 RepID=A0A8H6W875_MYCCL|nr:Beta-glucosidase [Mycena chlorophos]